MAGMIKENKEIVRRAQALKNFGAQASKQAPTNMFSKDKKKGPQFKRAPKK